jgi:hypothetical protein
MTDEVDALYDKASAFVTEYVKNNYNPNAQVAKKRECKAGMTHYSCPITGVKLFRADNAMHTTINDFFGAGAWIEQETLADGSGMRFKLHIPLPSVSAKKGNKQLVKGRDLDSGSSWERLFMLGMIEAALVGVLWFRGINGAF